MKQDCSLLENVHGKGVQRPTKQNIRWNSMCMCQSAFPVDLQYLTTWFISSVLFVVNKFIQNSLSNHVWYLYYINSYSVCSSNCVCCSFCKFKLVSLSVCVLCFVSSLKICKFIHLPLVLFQVAQIIFVHLFVSCVFPFIQHLYIHLLVSGVLSLP